VRRAHTEELQRLTAAAAAVNSAPRRDAAQTTLTTSSPSATSPPSAHVSAALAAAVSSDAVTAADSSHLAAANAAISVEIARATAPLVAAFERGIARQEAVVCAWGSERAALEGTVRELLNRAGADLTTAESTARIVAAAAATAAIRGEITLNPKHYNLNPKLLTLTPYPSALNPQP